MRHNKKITWILGVLVVGVWGVVAYQVVTAISQENSTLINTQISVNKTRDENQGRFVYHEDLKDPFGCVELQVQVRRGSSQHQNAIGTKESSPFILSGILFDKSKSVAMIETYDGGVFFLHEGDTAKSMRVIKIYVGKVKYSYQHKIYELFEKCQNEKDQFKTDSL